MDYKYIENLIERYFNCETNAQEEQILKDFFMQADIPASLKQYQPLFATLAEESKIELPADFDAKVMAQINGTATGRNKVVRMSVFQHMNHVLAPFYKAVASVALIITVGVTASKYWNNDADPVNYNYSKYHDTYSDPQVAYRQVSDALKDLSDVLKSNEVVATDTTINQTHEN